MGWNLGGVGGVVGVREGGGIGDGVGNGGPGGERVAFADLVRLHAPVAKRAAVLWGAGAEADDVVQEAFVKAFRAMPRFRAGQEFRPWLLRIVINETRNLHRGRTRREQREQRWWDDRTVTHPDTEAVVLTAVSAGTLAGAVDRLPEPLRAVVICRYLLELSEAETAASLRVPRGTVKSRLSRALARLRTEVSVDE
ncbi:RNA polymerase sigma factor [Microlunatus parietis]|uniref:RNA polymerase sigma factor n=1 Tax=Microlunatus parietis TaxID=682979 RepID=A0A7Y9I684_9ACTN|nr:RNA polymerase sigma factor [Microlunatus parietis]NYE70795.1 RNA polymerase sigma-70 factor (ECF subfamily) [Microlunatus parietis]